MNSFATNFGARQAAASIPAHRQYSLARALSALATGKRLTGIEAELDGEITRQHGASARGNTLRLPTGALLTRGMTAAGVSGSNYLVGTENLAGSFIDLLRAKSLIGQVNATMMPGLVGNVTIPKQTAASTAYWLTNEATAITESQITIGQLSLSPKTVGAYAEFSRLMLLQSNPAVDAMLLKDLAATLGAALDFALLSGTGSDGQPTGILNTAGLGTVVGTSLGLAGLLEFQTVCANNNADLSRGAYVTTPSVANLLQQRQRFAGTDGALWEGSSVDGKVLGAKAIGSTIVPSGTMLFGDFSQCVIGEWGILELATTESHGNNFKSGIVGVRAFLTVDVGVRNIGAFSKSSTIT